MNNQQKKIIDKILKQAGTIEKIELDPDYGTHIQATKGNRTKRIILPDNFTTDSSSF